jgi:hypothetical protein
VNLKNELNNGDGWENVKKEIIAKVEQYIQDKPKYGEIILISTCEDLLDTMFSDEALS